MRTNQVSEGGGAAGGAIAQVLLHLAQKGLKRDLRIGRCGAPRCRSAARALQISDNFSKRILQIRGRLAIADL